MTVATGVLVDAPLPQAPQYGLLQTANVQAMGTDEHFLNGLAVRGWPVGTPTVWDWRNAGVATKAIDAALANPTFNGFTVLLAETCNLRGVTPEEFRQRLERIMGFIAGYAVERVFYLGVTQEGGSVAQPGLSTEIPVPGGADSTVYPVGSAVVDAIEGLAQLEAAISTTARRGWIHAAPSMIAAWSGRGVNLVTPQGGNLVTLNGSIVVSGQGYTGLSGVFNGSTPVPPPAHTAPTGTQEWVYATGPVDIRRTPIESIPDAGEIQWALDRSTNEITYTAEQHYVLDWDAAFKAAVRVDRAL